MTAEGWSDGGTEDGTLDRDGGDVRRWYKGAGRPGGNLRPLDEGVQAYGGTYGQRQQPDRIGQGDRCPFRYVQHT